MIAPRRPLRVCVIRMRMRARDEARRGGSPGRGSGWLLLSLRWRGGTCLRAMPNVYRMFSHVDMATQNHFYLNLGIHPWEVKQGGRVARSMPLHLQRRAPAAVRAASAPRYRSASRVERTPAVPAHAFLQVRPAMQPAALQARFPSQPRLEKTVPAANRSGMSAPALSVRRLRDAAASPERESRPGICLLRDAHILPAPRELRLARAPAPKPGEREVLPVAPTRLRHRMPALAAETAHTTRTRQVLIQRADLVWRKAGVESAPSGIPVTAHGYAAGQRPFESVANAAVITKADAAVNRPATTVPVLDAAGTERLVEDVLRRAERRLRIERERRGIY